MPQSHYPLRGGPYLPAWSPVNYTLHAKHNIGQADAGGSSTGQEKDPLQDEVFRLRDEWEEGRERTFHVGSASLPMVWIALAICSAIVLFSYFAILGHG